MPGIGRTVRVVLITLSVVLGCALVLLGVLFALSPGTPRPFRDGDGAVLVGSVSQKIRVPINGSYQGMFIKGRDAENPVLLFLHGGTGMPEYFLAQNHPTGLEDYMTVCWWDRRGAGLSYDADAPRDSMSIDQYVADTLEVSEYLRTRFKKDKIYLMAHSGGSMIGMQAAAKAPQLYHAYIGVGQMSYQLASERLAYAYMVERYREAGTSRMVRILEAAPPGMSVPLPASYVRLRDKAMHELGIGTTRDMKSVITGVFLASWLCRDYTLREKLDIWRGKFASDARLWDTILATDLTKVVTGLEIPAYFLHGKYDYTVSYPGAKAYFDALSAPVKGFYTFTESAHSPMFEEPATLRRIMERDVLTGTTSLAD